MAKGWNANEFKRRLALVPASVRKNSDAANLDSAKEWVSTAKRLAPDDPETTGADIKGSIRNFRTETGGQAVVAGGETTTRDGVDYALQQEFGNSLHPAHPFFWPAWRLLRKRFFSRRRRAVNKAIKEFNDG